MNPIILENAKIPVRIRVINNAIDGVLLYLLFKFYWLSDFNINPKVYYSFWFTPVYYLSFPLAVFLYYFILEALFKRTLGKAVTNTVVVSHWNFKRATLKQISLRSLIRIMPTNLFFIFDTKDLIYEDMSATVAIKGRKLKAFISLERAKKEARQALIDIDDKGQLGLF